MRLSSVSLGAAALLFASQAAAADCVSVALEVIPECAQTCFVEGAPTIGCGGLDFECQCKEESALYSAIEACVAASCEESQFQDVLDGASAVCECAVGSSANAPGTASNAPTPTASFVPINEDDWTPTSRPPPTLFATAKSPAAQRPVAMGLGLVMSVGAMVLVAVGL